MKQAKWFIHPVLIFTLSTAALAISLFLYIHWYIGVSENLKSVIDHYKLDGNQFFEAKTWVVILILSLLVGAIMLGILTIFIYNQKTLQLYRLQHTFINNFTHELKTPVTSLKIYLETFIKYSLPRDEQLRYIGFMLQDTERLSGNINSILSLARIESRFSEWEFMPARLPETIETFIDQHRHAYSGCQIVVAPPAGASPISRLNLPLFEMLLMNILTNAIRYNASGKPRIDISLEQDRHNVRIHFRDNGIGIPQQEKAKIFRKFYQGRHDERVPVGGSGIGLYLVQQIARLHHGKITADSEGDGKGAVFTLTLPVVASIGGADERSGAATDPDH